MKETYRLLLQLLEGHVAKATLQMASNDLRAKADAPVLAPAPAAAGGGNAAMLGELHDRVEVVAELAEEALRMASDGVSHDEFEAFKRGEESTGRRESSARAAELLAQQQEAARRSMLALEAHEEEAAAEEERRLAEEAAEAERKAEEERLRLLREAAAAAGSPAPAPEETAAPPPAPAPAPRQTTRKASRASAEGSVDSSSTLRSRRSVAGPPGATKADLEALEHRLADADARGPGGTAMPSSCLLHGLSTSRPRRRRDSASADYPRRGRGVAASPSARTICATAVPA